MDYSKLIEERVKQFTTHEVIVKPLQSHPTYVIKIRKGKDGGYINPESLIRRAIPNSHPFSSLGIDGDYSEHSFYLRGSIPTNKVPTSKELWGLVLNAKRKYPNRLENDKPVSDWDFEELEDHIFNYLTGNELNTVEKQVYYLKDRVENEDKERYGDYWKALSAYWEEFTQTYKTWEEIYKALEKGSEYIYQWRKERILKMIELEGHPSPTEDKLNELIERLDLT